MDTRRQNSRKESNKYISWTVIFWITFFCHKISFTEEVYNNLNRSISYLNQNWKNNPRQIGKFKVKIWNQIEKTETEKKKAFSKPNLKVFRTHSSDHQNKSYVSFCNIGCLTLPDIFLSWTCQSSINVFELGFPYSVIATYLIVRSSKTF
jgi:hypothetical protein